MALFTTSGKRFREGTVFPQFGSVAVGVPPPPADPTTFEQEALPEIGDRKFLFWDTGRRLTNKRTVRWTFTHANEWSEWRATAWYGVPPTGPGGEPVVSFDSFHVGAGSLDPSPVDGSGSTFANGPGGQAAWPWSGDDHLVRTEWGSTTVRALDHLSSTSGAELNFSSLTTLIWGGDTSDTFQENDEDLPAGGVVTGVANTTAQQLTFAQGSGDVVLAGYVTPSGSIRRPRPWEIVKIQTTASILDDIRRWVADPSPEDLVRIHVISDLLEQVRGGRPTDDVFDGAIGDAVRKMTPTQLKTAITGTKSMLARGEAALKSLETLARRQR